MTRPSRRMYSPTAAIPDVPWHTEERKLGGYVPDDQKPAPDPRADLDLESTCGLPVRGAEEELAPEAWDDREVEEPNPYHGTDQDG